LRSLKASLDPEERAEPHPAERPLKEVEELLARGDCIRSPKRPGVPPR
jgi:hypothetical protein